MVYIPPKYPDAIPTLEDLPNRQDDVDWLVAARYNELKKELRACLAELGVLPKGEYADVAARLAAAGVPLYIELNILLNAFRIAINGSLVKHNMVDGIMDEFEDESGVDTEASISETYDAADDYYAPASVGYTSAYPTQDDDHVKATTKLGTDYWPYFATDPVLPLTGPTTSNEWLSALKVVTNQRFHIDLGSAKIVQRIYYENSHHIGTLTVRGVKNFTFWGSNSAASFAELTYGIDTGWTQITPSQSTFDKHIALDQADPKYIAVTNAVAYRYYAFKFADNYGDSDYMGIRHVELQTLAAPENMTLISESTEAETQPDTGRIVLFEEDVDAITENTDLKAYASRDNGANWVQATLTDEGDYDSGKRILTGVADVSGQAADKTIKWKVTTHNNKSLKLHGVGLLWK